MSVVAIGSARHSPGVTTTALLAAAAWPRPVLLVEADPAGGDLICWFRLYAEPNLLTLAAVGRATVDDADVWANSQQLPGAYEVRAVAAPVDAAQVRAAAEALSRAGLSEALGALGEVDVIVDVGRLDPDSPALSLFAAADVKAMVARPTLNHVDHLQVRVAWLKAQGVSDVRLVIVGDGPWKPTEVCHGAGVSALAAVLAHDPPAAAALAGAAAPGRALERSSLWRSAPALVEGLGESPLQPPAWPAPEPVTAPESVLAAGKEQSWR